MSDRTKQSTFLSGANAPFIADLYERFLGDPGSVDADWRAFFGRLGDDAHALADLRGASWQPRDTRVVGNGSETAPPAAPGQGGAAPDIASDGVKQAVVDSVRAIMLIRAYRSNGHMLADLDPLSLDEPEPHPELDPATYGFVDSDMDRPIFLDNVLGLEYASLRDILKAVRETYCSTIGIEFMHIQDPHQKRWLQERIEGEHNRTDFTKRGKVAILERLTAAEGFEKFLGVKYPGTKRFGLDGAESMIPALEQILKRGSQLGLEEVVLGMPHRGRLNVLANFMGKPFSAIFSEFQGGAANPDDVQGSGDVKYHLGTSSDREFDDLLVHLSLTANPSHLEAVDPVVIGKVRAKQAQRHDEDRTKVMGLLLHGDAAFAGQGLVAETFDFSNLRGYRTGGTIHFIVNNQIGFTTAPKYSRSSPYPSDVAKMVMAPIFHVNGDDPEAVVHAARIATEFRQRFKVDVVLDMFCYRRFGHNEGDEPAFTQPIMYRTIAKCPSTRHIYAEKLVAEGTVEADEPERMVKAFATQMDEAFEASGGYKPNKADWLEGAWSGLTIASGDARRGDTAVSLDTLREVGGALTHVPEGFDLNRKIARLLETKKKMMEGKEGVDWSTAEALSFGTLLVEGFKVRLSGQDSGRGTFSQRHSVLVDQTTEERHVSLNHIRDGQADYEVHDSPLSEQAVLGFEYGYSLAEPRALTIWEAQFGDFANGAQIIIDQFISSGEIKWLRMSGLVLLLPHGYEGQGPEHSSARLERYLQLCAEDNMQVCNCTTPANYFHVLRRQMHRDFRKPLVLMTPKSLLRHKLCKSTLEEFGPGSSFHRVLLDDGPLAADPDIARVVLCSGKLYYDLLEERQKRKIKDVCLLRLEQLYPFPKQALIKELRRFPQAEVVWCQEEPRNMGAWYFVDRRIEDVQTLVGNSYRRPRYIGRPPAAATASGLLKRHVEEQRRLVNEALSFN